MPAEQTKMKVVVRVRPYNRKELEQKQRCIIKVMDKQTLLFDPDEEDDEFFFQGSKQNYRDMTKRVNKKLPMDFDRVFDTDSTNLEIFNECTAPLVDSVLNGYNCSVFVYGATGAGKTFTMLGSQTCPGLTFLTMRDLFEKIQLQEDVRKFDVGVSYLEVYNENVMNLLTKTGPLKLREDSNGVVVSGLVLKPIYSAEELLRLLALGNTNRTQHPTDANAESSRSHAVFQVHIRMTERKTGIKRTVKLSMIDLAGSERAASTKGVGVRFKEGANINKSLLALGNCINKLADGMKHIPYRDSNLTRLLKDSLGGNCCTLMVANASMSSLTYEDTYNTLKYASRAKKIRTTLRQNELKTNMPKEFYVRKVTDMMSENERLMERNKELEMKVAQLERNTGGSGGAVYDEAELMPMYSQIDAVYSSLIKTQEIVYSLRSKIKLLNYRRTLKEDIENFKKVLTLNERTVQEDLMRFATYISNLAMQHEKQIEEVPRWRKKLEDAFRDVDKLKRDIKESKKSQILQVYLRYKDSEVRESKQNINNNYLRSINMELVENSDTLSRYFSKSIENLKQLYTTLEVTERLTPEIQKIYDKLLRHLRFNELEELGGGNQKAAVDGDKRIKTELRPNMHLNSSEEDDEVLASASASSVTLTAPSLVTSGSRKRTRSRRLMHRDVDLDLGVDSMDDDTDTDADIVVKDTFKKPRNLNETHVVSCADDEYSSGVETGSNMSSHGNVVVGKPAAQFAKPKTNVSRNLVSSMLSEQNVRAPVNREKIRQALMKSNNFSHQELQRTMAAAVQKENIKFNTTCVRKSPRAMVAKVLSGTATFARKQTTSRLVSSTVGNSNSNTKETPKVRINRAASFRVKK